MHHGQTQTNTFRNNHRERRSVLAGLFMLKTHRL
jgi:hypothetical protein